MGSPTLAASRRKADLEREEEERAKRPVPFKPAVQVKMTAAEEAKALFKRIGDLSAFKLFQNRILVAKFQRTTIGSGRLLAAEHTKTEDKWQGKTGLVVKKGTIAFMDDEATGTFWHGDNVEVGDWVFFNYGDGTDIEICPDGSTDRIYCKVLKEGEIIGSVPRPDFFL